MVFLGYYFVSASSLIPILQPNIYLNRPPHPHNLNAIAPYQQSWHVYYICRGMNRKIQQTINKMMCYSLLAAITLILMNTTSLAKWDHPEYLGAKQKLAEIAAERQRNPLKYSLKGWKEKTHPYMKIVQRTFYLPNKTRKRVQNYRAPQVVSKRKPQVKNKRKQQEKRLANNSFSTMVKTVSLSNKRASKQHQLSANTPQQNSFQLISATYNKK